MLSLFSALHCAIADKLGGDRPYGNQVHICAFCLYIYLCCVWNGFLCIQRLFCAASVWPLLLLFFLPLGCWIHRRQPWRAVVLTIISLLVCVVFSQNRNCVLCCASVFANNIAPHPSRFEWIMTRTLRDIQVLHSWSKRTNSYWLCLRTLSSIQI